MDDHIHAELLDAYREADRLTDLADMYANDGDYKRAGSTYSRAAGVLMAAVDAAFAADEKVSA